MWDVAADALLAPIDPSRPHDVGVLVSWHGRVMVLAWGVLIPLGVLAARFFKVTPNQDWPTMLDNQVWWRSHLRLQYSAGAAMVLGLALILARTGDGVVATVHQIGGWTVLTVTAAQFLAGWLRGTKGGPTEPAADGSWNGDHYDMTLRRKVFEYVHKTLGYMLIMLAAAVILSGLWAANAPGWMWVGILGWWALLIAAFCVFQRRGMAMDTYQAIWGPNPAHPGNQIAPIGWGVSRRSDTKDGSL